MEKARAPRLCGLETAGFLGKMAIVAVAAIDLGAVAAIRSYVNYMSLESTTSSCIVLNQFYRKCCSKRQNQQQKAEDYSAFCSNSWRVEQQKAEDFPEIQND